MPDPVFEIGVIDRRRQISVPFKFRGGDEKRADFPCEFCKHDVLRFNSHFND